MLKWAIHIILGIATALGVAMTRPARAAVDMVKPDMKFEAPKAAKKTRRLGPPCLQGTVRILGAYVIRDGAGNVVAIGVLRQRC